LFFVAVLAALCAACTSSPSPVHSTAQRTMMPQAGGTALTMAQAMQQVLAEHKSGRRTILKKADAQKFIKAFIVTTKTLPTVGYRVDCPRDLNLTGPRHGQCVLHVAGHSVPYDIWVDDATHQVRIGGHGFAIEMTRVRNVVANSIQQRLPRMDISPYDVQCGSADTEVVIVAQGSVITCEFTADAMLMLLGIRFGDMKGHLIVQQLSHR
jgi:hypothetical protein